LILLKQETVSGSGMVNIHPLNPHIMPSYTHKMAIVS